MFDNISKIFLFNYRVSLDNIVNAICVISFDIGKQLEEAIEIKDKEKGFTIEDLFKDSFLTEIGIRKESLTDQTAEDGTITPRYTNEQFFSFIADHYNQTLFHYDEFLTGLEKSDILLIDKEQRTFLGNGEKARDRLIPALKNAKILKQLISNLNCEKIQLSLQKIEMFENDIFYRNTITAVKQENQPLIVILNISYIDSDKVDKQRVDKDNYWVNIDYYGKLKHGFVDVDEYSLLVAKDTQKEIGLVINEDVLLFANEELTEYILHDKIHDYFWGLLSQTYSLKVPLATIKPNENVDEFKELITDVSLNQLLSYLKNNFYIKDVALIKAEFGKFFNSVVLLENLEFLDNYQFLMSSNYDEETALGIYSSEKKGSSYNLLHWLNHEGPSKVRHFRNPDPIEQKKNIIYTLKPAICFYFLGKYFEDLFETILKVKEYNYLSNRNFFDKGNIFCEIDFLVKTENKFILFETKTKLSKLYIDAFLKQSSKIIDRFKPMIDNGIDIEFVLLGGYSDFDVKDYQYFIDESADKKEKGYNQSRENLNCLPYYFKVPIPDKEGKQIICIAEPEYNNLENLVLELCQK